MPPLCRLTNYTGHAWEARDSFAGVIKAVLRRHGTPHTVLNLHLLRKCDRQTYNLCQYTFNLKRISCQIRSVLTPESDSCLHIFFQSNSSLSLWYNSCVPVPRQCYLKCLIQNETRMTNLINKCVFFNSKTHFLKLTLSKSTREHCAAQARPACSGGTPGLQCFCIICFPIW